MASAIDKKLPGCEEADEIAGTDLVDVWSERHAAVESSTLPALIDEVIEAIGREDIELLNEALEQIEVIDVA